MSYSLSKRIKYQILNLFIIMFKFIHLINEPSWNLLSYEPNPLSTSKLVRLKP